MKKYITNIKTLAVLLIAVSSFTACSNDDNTLDNQPAQPSGKQVYTMTVTAGKSGNGATRALSLDGSTMNATWTAGDKVSVYKGETLLGELTAQSGGLSTVLTGKLTGYIAVADNLTLKFLSPAYESQDGTLDYIAEHCDYATSTIEVASVEGGIITTTADADFQNQQAIVKFTLKNADGSANISASNLKLSVGNYSFTFTPVSTTSDFYLAIPTVSNVNVALVSTVGSATYDYAKTGVSFTNDNYYQVNVRMSECVDLASVTEAHKGRIIGVDGKIYSNILSATTAGTTPSAMVGYVGSKNDQWGLDSYSSVYNHGLAIALTPVKNADGDEGYGSMNYATADYAAPAYKRARPTNTSAWFLPSRTQLSNTIFTANRFGLIRSNDSYWSSTSSVNDSRYRMAYGFGSNKWIEGSSTNTAYTRSVFAF